ncbi:hypothetical protein [Blastopirellula marina]|uniref:Uncharacterized protein n=1 Tax=Blastopirellula marina TaxID=124 RepID=A0A2S8GBC0_9BACT|nr:hypothetical protein [Blastopirellula marina]PQO41756.1 hypothetical protein C5Y98_03280 [Blastopirellula marina]PTL46199.1 hypothetical protein C5Y97_03280 [Blastopirellula marina]
MAESSLSTNREDEAAPSSWGRLRFRFSIFSLMLLSVIVGLLASHWQTSQKLIEAKEEADQLRRTYHLLVPNDSSKIQVLLQETNLAGEWQWRIALPEGGEYEVACQVGDLPVDGSFPSSPNRVSLPAGEEYLVTVRLQRAGDKKWETTIVGTLAHEMGFAFRRSRSSPIPDQEVWWMQYERVKVPAAPRGELFKHLDRLGDRVFYFKSTGIFFAEQVSFPADQPIVLFDQRVLDYDERGNPIEAIDPSDGMMIWLQRHEKGAGNDQRSVPGVK